MGGIKKRPLAQMEKIQQRESQQTEEKKKEQKQQTQQKRLPFLIPKMPESEIIKLLSPLKAITVYGAAKALGVNASVANMMLKNLEQKRLIRKVGGFSGHYIYSIAS